MLIFCYIKRIYFDVLDILLWNVLRCPSGPGSFYLYGGLMNKEFKTYDEQISLLNSRGIIISTSQEKSEAKKLYNTMDTII